MKAKTHLGLAVLLLVWTLSGPVQSAAAALTEGVVSYWQFDEPNGTTAWDSVGQNDGNIHDANRTTGQVNGALSFDGDGDYIDVGTNLVLTEVSVCAWIKTSNSGGQVVFSKKGRSYGGHQAYSLTTGNLYGGGPGTVSTRIKQPGFANFIDLATTERIDDGAWHFVAMSYDGSLAKLYIDGALKATSSPRTTITYVSETEMALIGATTDTEGNPANLFNGDIDEVVIYNRALSADELQELYQVGLSGNSLPAEIIVAINGLQDALEQKLNALEEMDKALDMELDAYNALAIVLETGAYADLTKQNISIAIRDTNNAIRNQQQLISTLQKSIEKLENALLNLGVAP